MKSDDILNLGRRNGDQKTIVVGDVHGCLDELQELLMLVRYRPNQDTLIFVGDLLDRGPRGPEVVRFVRELAQDHGAICVMSNHDEKYVRFHRWLEKADGDEGRIKMTFPPSKRRDFARLSQEDLNWLASLPYYHQGSGFLVVHAGICPRRHRTFEDLSRRKYRDRLVRLRTVDDEGKMISPGRSAPEARHWSETYDGRFGLVVFGHDPREDRLVRKAPFALGIDTGCCFGGSLTAMILSASGRECLSVAAHRTYAAFVGCED